MSTEPKQAKVRLTVTVDADLARDAAEAVAQGESPSVSAWVNQAMAGQAQTRQKLAALAEAVAAYEAEFGAFTDEELAEQERADKAAAEAVRRAYRAQRAARTA